MFDDIEGLTEEQQKALSEKFNSALTEKVDTEVSGLKGKVEELLAEKKKMQEVAEQEKSAAEKAAEDAARKSGDVEAIDKSWQEKYSKLEGEKGDSLASANKLIHELTVGQAATKLAAELGGENANGLMPHLLPRLDVDTSNGQVKVLDVNGQPSALTIEELKSELMETSYLAPLIVISRAAGGGASGNKSAGGASGGNLTGADKIRANLQERLKNKGI